jgi:hypothetical protein
MPAQEQTRLQIRHVLLINLVGYSKSLDNEQSELLRELNEVVNGTTEFRLARAYAGLDQKDNGLEQARRAGTTYHGGALSLPVAEQFLWQSRRVLLTRIPPSPLCLISSKCPPSARTLFSGSAFWDRLGIDPWFQKLCQDRNR